VPELDAYGVIPASVPFVLCFRHVEFGSTTPRNATSACEYLAYLEFVGETWRFGEVSEAMIWDNCHVFITAAHGFFVLCKLPMALQLTVTDSDTGFARLIRSYR